MPDVPFNGQDRELLARLDERVNAILQWTKKHDESHQRTEGRALAAIIAAAIAVLSAGLNVILR